MIGILLFAGLAVLSLALLLARFGKGRVRLRPAADPRPPMPRAVLQTLSVELLEALGFRLTAGGQHESCLVGARSDALGETRFVVVLSPATDDSLVEQAEVLAAAETVKAEGGARGMLITVGEIETRGLADLEAPLELVDRKRLRHLIAQHLPERLGTLDRYRGFAATTVENGEAPPDVGGDRSQREDRWSGEGGSDLGPIPR